MCVTRLSPVAALTVGVTVTSSLETNVPGRLAWLEVVLQTINVRVSICYLFFFKLLTTNAYLL